MQSRPRLTSRCASVKVAKVKGLSLAALGSVGGAGSRAFALLLGTLHGITWCLLEPITKPVFPAYVELDGYSSHYCAEKA
jgi:hypothetical protein